MASSDDIPKYGIRELAEAGGVSRRTVRYYVQRGLLPTPTGTGRGKHYTEGHLRRLISIRERQEAGESLASIAAGVAPRPAPAAPPPRPRATGRLERDTWQRQTLAPGVELNIRVGAASPETLARLLREAADALAS